jgi:STE24 endopeptidase
MLKAHAVGIILLSILASAHAVPDALAIARPQPEVAESQSVPAHTQPPRQPQVTEYTLPPDELAKAKALYETSTVLYFISTLFGIFVLWAILRLRAGPLFRDLAERASRNSFLQTLIFVPLLMLLIAIASLPLDICSHYISRAYGLSVQNWASWAGDWCKGEALFLVVSILAAAVLFWIIRKSPQRWWFYFWMLTLPFVFFIVFIAPVILDPMFNTFVPLENTEPQLVSAIEKITLRGGLSIPSDRMFEMKASEKVTTYNAYVTGVGATKRVVVWDNTARDMTTPEILFVFGHEMGHYVLDHIYKGLAFFSVMAFAGFWAGRKLVLKMLSGRGDKWCIRGIDDLAALPVFLLALALLSLVSQPIANSFSRHLEHQADIYGLEVTHGLFPDNREVAASSFQKLGEQSYDYPTPNPLLVFWLYDHPTIAQRIRFSLHYDPWNSTAGPKYVK